MSHAFPDTQPLVLKSGSSSRPYVVWSTMLLTLAMLGLTAATLYTANTWNSPGEDVLLKWGGNSAMTTLDNWNGWRLIAAKLQLGSTVGIVTFIPFFWVVAGAFERRYGGLSLLLSFLLISALSSVATLYFRDFKTVSVGAGGPALGLVLCLLVARFRKVDAASDSQDLSILKGLAVLPWLSLLGYAVYKGKADFASLICGLACGIFLGFVLESKAGKAAVGMRRWRGTFATSMAAAIAIAVGMWNAPQPPYYWAEVLALKQAAREYESQINPLNTRFEAFMNQAMDSDIQPKELVSQMEAELIPQWRAVEQRWSAFTINPAMPDAVMLASMKQYPQNRRAFLEATFRGWSTDDESAFIEAAKHKEKLEQARLVLIGESPAKISPQPPDLATKPTQPK